MAKKHRSKAVNRKRDTNIIANPLPQQKRLLPSPILTVLKNAARIDEIQDMRRRSFPDRRIPAPHLLVTATPKRVRRKPHLRATRLAVPALDQHLPKHTVLCARRKIRREVLMALGRGGSRHRRKYRTNENSKIHCKRR